MLEEWGENAAGFIDDHLAFCEATAVHLSRPWGEPAGEREYESLGFK